jgi:hypothetical protein
MPQTPAPAAANLEALSGRLLDAARLAERVAEASLGKVRMLFLLGLLAAIWLGYALAEAFTMGLPATLTAMFVLALPALTMGWVYRMLREAKGLPQRVSQLLGRLKNRAAEVQTRFRSAAPGNDNQGGNRLTDLLRVGRVLAEVRALSGEAEEASAAFAGVVMLTNPLFAIVATLASGATLLLILTALVTGLVYLF